jgi:hypothetical protein
MVLLMIGENLFEGPLYANETLAKQIIWEIRHGDEAREKLGESEPPPIVAADTLHPWVWDAARPHWESGNHDAALTAAAINVSSRLKKKVGRRDIDNGKLVQQAFSLEPPKEGKPRLRLIGEENPDLFRDVHLGAMNLGVGLYAAVRNPLTHLTPDEHPLSEHETLESLAAFSLLARWIERAEVVTFEG